MSVWCVWSGTAAVWYEFFHAVHTKTTAHAAAAYCCVASVSTFPLRVFVINTSILLQIIVTTRETSPYYNNTVVVMTYYLEIYILWIGHYDVYTCVCASPFLMFEKSTQVFYELSSNNRTCLLRNVFIFCLYYVQHQYEHGWLLCWFV